MKGSKQIIVGILILALWFFPASVVVAQDLTKGIKFLDDVKKVERWALTGKQGEIKQGEMPRQEPATVIHVAPGSEFLIRGRAG